MGPSNTTWASIKSTCQDTVLRLYVSFIPLNCVFLEGQGHGMLMLESAVLTTGT